MRSACATASYRYARDLMHQANDHATNSSPSKASANQTVSERKRAANRANAKRSTGPRTAQGKARSAMNALRHGILAKAAFNVSIEGEEKRAEFETLLAGLAQEYQPRTMTEIMTVQQLTVCYWKLAKVWHYEQERAYCEWNKYEGSEEIRDINLDNAFQKMEDGKKAMADGEFLYEAGLIEPTIPRASAKTILRYQGAITTMMTRCLRLLEKRGSERKKSGESIEELDYISEVTPAQVSEEDSREQPQNAAGDAELHKRTQKAAVDAEVSSAKEDKPTSDAPASSIETPRDPRASA